MRFLFFLSSDRTKQFTKLSLQRYLVLNKRAHAKKKANKFKKNEIKIHIIYEIYLTVSKIHL